MRAPLLLFLFSSFALLSSAQDRPNRPTREAKIVQTFEQRRPLTREPMPRVVQRPSQLLEGIRIDRVARVVLPEPSSEDIESSRAEISKSRRIAVGLLRRVALTPSSEGTWSELSVQSSARVWMLAVQSTGALGMRLHFSNFHLPPETRLVVYPEKHPEEAVEYTEEGPFRNSDFWSAPMFDDALILELYDGAAKTRGSVPHYFDVVGLTHSYRYVIGPLGDAGSCNLNAVCYPDWASQGDAVGRISGVDSLGEFACSGTLVTNSSSDFSPFFFTAAHCFQYNQTAQTAAVFWMYKTPTCQSTIPPDIHSVPVTVGAALMSLGDVDASLLYLTGSIPNTIPFEGWTTADPGVGDGITQIHHPEGSYRRISFGKRMSDDPDYSSYHQILWTSGVTEPGSSGSPGYNATKQIVGQLSLGSSSCQYPQGTDFIGKFSLNYDGLNRTSNDDVLTGGTPLDQYAANNMRSKAAVISSPPAKMRLAAKTGHDEWLAFPLPPNAALTLQIDWNSSPYDDRASGVNQEAFLDSGTTPLNWLNDNGYNKYFVRAGSSGSTLYFHYWNSVGAYHIFNILPTVKLAGPPTIQTYQYTNTTADFVQVGSQGDDGGLAVDLWFEYGTDPNFKTFSATPTYHYDAPTDLSTFVSTAYNISQLTPQTTYYIRAVAQNADGKTFGNVLTVTTQAPNPNIGFASPTFKRVLMGQQDTQCEGITNQGNTSLTKMTATATPPFQVTTFNGYDYGAYVCVLFSPTAPGTFHGTLTFSVYGVSISYALTGTAQYAYGDVTFTPTTNTGAYGFPAYWLGNTVPGNNVRGEVTLTNSGAALLHMSNIDFDMHYGWGDKDRQGHVVYNLQTDCGTTLSIGASCHLFLVFTPTSSLSGYWSADISFTDDSQAGSHTLEVDDFVVQAQISPQRPPRPGHSQNGQSQPSVSDQKKKLPAGLSQVARRKALGE